MQIETIVLKQTQTSHNPFFHWNERHFLIVFVRTELGFYCQTMQLLCQVLLGKVPYWKENMLLIRINCCKRLIRTYHILDLLTPIRDWNLRLLDVLTRMALDFKDLLSRVCFKINRYLVKQVHYLKRKCICFVKELLHWEPTYVTKFLYKSFSFLILSFVLCKKLFPPLSQWWKMNYS